MPVRSAGGAGNRGSGLAEVGAVLTTEEERRRVVERVRSGGAKPPGAVSENALVIVDALTGARL